MTALYPILILFVASAWGYEVEQYRRVESTYINKLRDAADPQAQVPDQNFTRRIWSAIFNDDRVIFTFNINKVRLGDNVPFCEMVTDFFTIRPSDKTTFHNQTIRQFQLKAGKVTEKQVSPSFTNSVNEKGQLMSVFVGYPPEAHALSIGGLNSDGSGWSEKSYYNMNQVVDDAIVDYENIKSDFKPVDAKSFLANVPLSVRKFLTRFADAHRNSVLLGESLRKCLKETPQSCEDLKKQLDVANRSRDEVWSSFSSAEASSLRPLPPPVLRPRPIPQEPGYFGGLFAR